MTTVRVRTLSPLLSPMTYGPPEQSSCSATRAMATSAPNFSAWEKARPARAWPEMPVGKPR